ncbi:hypothetical protein PLESTF_001674500 [Pleodorina starrii]|nr:hypothetical protein PLESTF_001674500 [Pleodorina starrii]
MRLCPNPSKTYDVRPIPIQFYTPEAAALAAINVLPDDPITRPASPTASPEVTAHDWRTASILTAATRRRQSAPDCQAFRDAMAAAAASVAASLQDGGGGGSGSRSSGGAASPDIGCEHWVQRAACLTTEQTPEGRPRLDRAHLLHLMYNNAGPSAVVAATIGAVPVQTPEPEPGDRRAPVVPSFLHGSGAGTASTGGVPSFADILGTPGTSASAGADTGGNSTTSTSDDAASRPGTGATASSTAAPSTSGTHAASDGGSSTFGGSGCEGTLVGEWPVGCRRHGGALSGSFARTTNPVGAAAGGGSGGGGGVPLRPTSRPMYRPTMAPLAVPGSPPLSSSSPRTAPSPASRLSSSGSVQLAATPLAATQSPRDVRKAASCAVHGPSASAPHFHRSTERFGRLETAVAAAAAAACPAPASPPLPLAASPASASPPMSPMYQPLPPPEQDACDSRSYLDSPSTGARSPVVSVPLLEATTSRMAPARIERSRQPLPPPPPPPPPPPSQQQVLLQPAQPIQLEPPPHAFVDDVTRMRGSGRSSQVCGGVGHNVGSAGGGTRVGVLRVPGDTVPSPAGAGRCPQDLAAPRSSEAENRPDLQEGGRLSPAPSPQVGPTARPDSRVGASAADAAVRARKEAKRPPPLSLAHPPPSPLALPLSPATPTPPPHPSPSGNADRRQWLFTGVARAAWAPIGSSRNDPAHPDAPGIPSPRPPPSELRAAAAATPSLTARSLGQPQRLGRQNAAARPPAPPAPPPSPLPSDQHCDDSAAAAAAEVSTEPGSIWPPRIPVPVAAAFLAPPLTPAARYLASVSESEPAAHRPASPFLEPSAGGASSAPAVGGALGRGWSVSGSSRASECGSSAGGWGGSCGGGGGGGSGRVPRAELPATSSLITKLRIRGGAGRGGADEGGDSGAGAGGQGGEEEDDGVVGRLFRELQEVRRRQEAKLYR